MNPLLIPATKPDTSADRAFGRSFHIDFYGVRPELCEDLNFCYRLLDNLVAHLGMHKQSPPFLFRSPEDAFPEKAGLSGWVPLIESGISIHTLTVKEFVTVDVYTCGGLDQAQTLRFLCERLAPRQVEHQLVVRGTRYHA